MFGAYRLAANLPTRHIEERPPTLNLYTHSGPDTEREEHWLPLTEYPIISALLPELPIANILTGRPSTELFQVNPKIVNLLRDTESRRTAESAGTQFEVSRILAITEFAKLLAKIAYSYAIAELGFGSFKSPLPSVIVGESLNLPDFVGGIAELGPNDNLFLGQPGERVNSTVQHYLNLELVQVQDMQPYLTVVIQLLQDFAPTYRVVVAAGVDEQRAQEYFNRKP